MTAIGGRTPKSEKICASVKLASDSHSVFDPRLKLHIVFMDLDCRFNAFKVNEYQVFINSFLFMLSFLYCRTSPVNEHNCDITG